MASRTTSAYSYTSLLKRPLADIPYASDDEVDLTRRAIQRDHPPVDIQRRVAARMVAPAPPVGVWVASGVVVVLGVWLVLVGSGVGGLRLAGVWARLGCGLVGAFCSVSGSYTLYASVYNDQMQHEGGYRFPSYHR